MTYEIESCKYGDTDYIIDKLVEYNLSQVPAKQETLFDTLDKYPKDIPYLHGKELANKLFEETRINASEKEIENFYNRYIKTLRLKIDNDGNFSIEITR